MFSVDSDDAWLLLTANISIVDLVLQNWKWNGIDTIAVVLMHLLADDNVFEEFNSAI